MSENIRTYSDLVVWQRAVDLAVACYSAAARFPKEETYGLAAQVRRASVAIPANIAEGYGRSYTKDYIRFLAIAHGSLMEVETHIRIGQRLGYIDPSVETDLLDAAGHVGRMLNGLMNALKDCRSSDP